MVVSVGWSNRPFRIFFLVLCLALAADAAAESRDQIAPTLSRANRAFTIFPPRGHRSPTSSNPLSAPDFGNIDSIKIFTGDFHALGVGSSGNPQSRWLFAMAGGQPELGGTTSFNAPIVPVSLDLLDRDGSVRVVNGHRLHYSVLPFVRAVVN